MLSRKSVRIKVMQLLYMMNRDEDLKPKDISKLYWDNIDKSFELLMFNIYLLINITKYSLDDFDKRKNKYLPSDLDKAFRPKFCENDLIHYLDNNRKLKIAFRKYGFENKVDFDFLKKIYYDYAKEPGYLKFLAENSDHESYVEVLLDLYRYAKKVDAYVEIVEDNYVNWEDDKSVVVGAMKKIIKEIPAKTDDFFLTYYPDDETIKDFGEQLITKTISEDSALFEIVSPTFENWDSDRIAILDMILLKMAVCEFLHFETIPTKVTLNEYVDLAKLYSTPKSKEFINGVLDRIANDLLTQGKMVKSGRGLLE